MPKYFFTLKNIIPHEIEKKYGISTLNFTTKIVDLTSTSQTQNYVFIDETMKSHSCVVTMYDYLGKALPLSTQMSCFWCRHGFNNSPIGCPIQYIPSILFKQYFSEINKDTYTIKGTITEQIAQIIKNNIHPDSQFEIDDNNYYITDGVFCSFNCCLAFIKNKKHNPLYSNSESLLKQIFYTFFDKTLEINKAASWRLLSAYGGTLSINEFRKSFNKIFYKDLKNYITDIPICKPIGFIFEKKIKF